MFEALPLHIALLGDTQETLFFERMIGREHNIQDSRVLIADLAQQRPGRLIMLGDSVSYGTSKNDWKQFDQLITPVRSLAIPVDGILGNHDYWGGGDCLKNAYERYPKLKKSHWYVEEYKDLAFIFLDSNRDQLGEDKWSEQKKWFTENVKLLDEKESIKGFFVFSHHPPYTNSKTTSDDLDTKDAFTPSLYNSKKGLGLISGHAHGYEHFVKAGRHFIVSGGGGGPRVNYHTGKTAPHKDLYQAPAPRPFHYLFMSLVENGVWITARGIEKGGKKAINFDRYFIEYKGKPSP